MDTMTNLLVGFFILYMIICLPTIVWNLGQVLKRWLDESDRRRVAKYPEGWYRDKDFLQKLKRKRWWYTWMD